MKVLHCKGCIFTLALLAVFRLAECRHLLDDGFAEGRMVNIQDRVIESCRGHFMCKPFPYHRTLGLTCIHANNVCDGTKHCENGEDENPEECHGHGEGHGHGQGESGMVIYDSHASDHAGDLPLDRDYDVLDEPKGGGIRDTSPIDSHKKGSGTGKTRSRPHVIVIQQAPAHAPAPKKMTHMPRKKGRPAIPLPIPYPVRPPMGMIPPMGMMPPMGMGMGMNPLLMAQLLDR